MQQSLFAYTPPVSHERTRRTSGPALPSLPHGHAVSVAVVLATITTSRDVYEVAFTRATQCVRIDARAIRRWLATFDPTDRIAITLNENAIIITYAGGHATMQHTAWCLERKAKLPPRRERFKADYEAQCAAARADFAKREAKAIRTIQLV